MHNLRKSQSESLTTRVWAVIGASSDLGQAFADAIESNGDTAIEVSRSVLEAEDETPGSRPRLAADVTLEQGRRAMAERLSEPAIGLVLAQGLYIRTPSRQESAQMERVIHGGPSDLIRSLLQQPGGADRDIKIIAIGSATAHHPTPRNPAYAEAKALLEADIRARQKDGDTRFTLGIPGYLRGKTERRGLLTHLLPEEDPVRVAETLLAWSDRGKRGGATHPLWGAVMTVLGIFARATGRLTPYQRAAQMRRGIAAPLHSDVKNR